MPGALLFARYAYPPNNLGLCGPEDHIALLEASIARDPYTAELARHFDGAWPYLELIAGACGIQDPLDRRVVEAYWVGNGLLDRVTTSSMGAHVEDRFRDRSRLARAQLARTLSLGAVPHHNFHVFCVYPWVGLLRAGPAEPALMVLDRCRVRWGSVLRVERSEAVVSSHPLTWDGEHLALGSDRILERVRLPGGTILPEVVPGDHVSMHWGWICDRITKADVAALQRYTERHLALADQAIRAHPEVSLV